MSSNANQKDDHNSSNTKISQTSAVLKLQTSVKQPAPLKFNLYDCQKKSHHAVVNSIDKQFLDYTTSDDDESNSNSRDDSPNVEQSKLTGSSLIMQNEYTNEKLVLNSTNPLAKRKIRKSQNTIFNSIGDTKPNYHQHQRILLNKNDMESSTDEDVNKHAQQALTSTAKSLTQQKLQNSIPTPTTTTNSNIIKK
jgi:hypothetical protein